MVLAELCRSEAWAGAFTMHEFVASCWLEVVFARLIHSSLSGLVCVWPACLFACLFCPDVPRNADEQQIKKAYRKKALEWHPDKGHPDASQAFHAIKMAYDLLMAQLSSPKAGGLMCSGRSRGIYSYVCLAVQCHARPCRQARMPRS